MTLPLPFEKLANVQDLDGEALEEARWQHDYNVANGLKRSNGIKRGKLKEPRGKFWKGSAVRTLLEVAKGLPQPFPLHELVLGCWVASPEQFGLPGNDKWPSDRRVYSYLPGEKGLLKAGLLKKVGEDRYAVTEALVELLEKDGNAKP